MATPEHIIVAADNEGVSLILVDVLSEAGYRVSIAGNGEAVRKIVARSDRVDLVVLDSLTPDERSTSLTDHLRDLRIPVVAISGHPLRMGSAFERGSRACRQLSQDSAQTS
jgi:DNA-binding NtrC family response regulator